ncbi:thermonuclease family protein [Actinopolymorpha sp. B9G3]|uniref:thermonuclease family protein n=1 Tax=Actinopolymorpha sp. B9G3 TaxID=3158970 RepID=UPI0032D97368
MRHTAALAAAVLALTGCGVEAQRTDLPPKETGWTRYEPSPGRIPAEVVEVVDGDTVKVRRKEGTTETLRLIGLDTPETKDPNEPVGCYGPEASAHAKELLDGAKVRLETDSTQGRTDRYGRTLAYVWMANGSMFNEVMIGGGYGREYTYDNAYRHQRLLKTAESEAKRQKAGLWGACPDDKPADKPAPAGGGTDKRYDTLR